MTTRNLNAGLQVESTLDGPGEQPWGALPCYVYNVAVRVPSRAIEHETKFYGSNMDYMQNRVDEDQAMWAVLYEMLDAFWDSNEFFANAMGEPDGRDSWETIVERMNGVKALIEFADSIGSELQDNEDAIREHAE